MPNKIVVLMVALFACGRALPGTAQDAAPQFYCGETVTIVVGTTVGGPYDTVARLLGRHFGKHLPGELTIVVTNMPGAGSDVASAYIARVAAKDCTFIAAPFASEPLDPILEDAADLNFDPRHVNYLGSALSDETVCIVRRDAPTTTFDDTFKTQVIMGGVAANSVTGYMPIVLNNVLGTKFNAVFDYPGLTEVIMAIEKGEIHGGCGLFWLGSKSQYPDLFKNGEIKIVVQENDKGLPELNKMGVPLTVSYAHDEHQRSILEVLYSQGVFARPYFVAAEVPADRLQILRRAFMDTWHDPDLLADAAKMNLDVGPMSGEEVQSLLQKIYASSPALLRSVKEAVQLK